MCSLAAQRMRFFHGKPSKVTGFQRKSGQMFLYINLVRISLYSNWEWQVNSLALGRVHFWLGLLSVNFCSVHKAVLSKIVDLVEVYLINPLLSRFFFLWSPVEMMFVSFWFNFKLGTGSTSCICSFHKLSCICKPNYKLDCRLMCLLSKVCRHGAP